MLTRQLLTRGRFWLVDLSLTGQTGNVTDDVVADMVLFNLWQARVALEARGDSGKACDGACSGSLLQTKVVDAPITMVTSVSPKNDRRWDFHAWPNSILPENMKMNLRLGF